MRLTDLNPERDIGANCLYAEIGPFRMVVDCGLHPKKVGAAALPNLKKIPDGTLDFIVVTHCHLDHLGALPVLFRHQPQALVLMSRPSREIAARMLRNSLNVMKRQRDELSIKEYPLFTGGELEALEPKIFGLQFLQPKRLSRDGEEIEITLHPAGHVVGAAGVKIVYKRRAIFFTGDVRFSEQRTLTGADFPEGPLDTLVMETTRGSTERPEGFDREAETARLIDTVRTTLLNGGSVLIPSFALGRMQEILAILNDARKAGQIPECPVYASGLGLDLVDYFDAISRKAGGGLRFRRQVLQELGVRSLRQKFKGGNPPAESAIYALSSGMLVENTPSYACAAALCEDAKNAICFVGYCDPDTPGGRLQRTESGETFSFDAVEFRGKLRAHVEKFDLSGHADRESLMRYARKADPRAVVLTHGDPAARDWFLDEFALEGGNRKVVDIPQGVPTDI